jgi:hypothetical protein
MSSFTVTIDCPRLYYEDGTPCECGGEIQVECDESGRYIRETRWEPAEYPTREVLSQPTGCGHEGMEVIPFTAIEAAEWRRRAAERCDRYDADAEAGWPCRCGDLCRC